MISCPEKTVGFHNIISKNCVSKIQSRAIIGSIQRKQAGTKRYTSKRNNVVSKLYNEDFESVSKKPSTKEFVLSYNIYIACSKINETTFYDIHFFYRNIL